MAELVVRRGKCQAIGALVTPVPTTRLGRCSSGSSSGRLVEALALDASLDSVQRRRVPRAAS
ncbi:MAG TPA: hypothetical protein VF106_04430 [Actinophytocola sp.]